MRLARHHRLSRSAALATLAAALGLAGASAPAQDAPAAEELEFANRLLKDRRYEQAAQEYERFLQSKPTGAPAASARFGLASARRYSGDFAAARGAFERFLVDFPEHPNAPSAHFFAGELAYMLGDLPAARRELEIYTSRYRDQRHAENAWTYLGEVSFRLNDFPVARAAYQHAIDDFPTGQLLDRSRYGLARTLAALKEYDLALEALQAILRNPEGEGRDKARFQAGSILAEAGRPAESVVAFETLERDTPRSPLVPEARLRRAEALTRMDRGAEAVALLTPLAAGDGPLAPRAAYALATAQIKQDRSVEALAGCEEALRRFTGSPLVPLFLFRAAEAEARLGRHAESRARYEKLVEDFPRDAWADVALVRAAEQALRARDPAGARKLAARLPEAFPNSVQKPSARLIEAQAALALQEPQSAVDLLEPLQADAAIDKVTAQSARLTLGVAYRAAGQPEKAAETLRDLGDAPADAQYVLGAGHFEAQRYAEAVPLLEAYLTAKPGGDVAPDALALLAMAQSELGQRDAADASLARLESDHPQHQALAQARLRLGEAALEAKDHDRAIERLRPVAGSATEPSVRGRALWGLGWSLLESGHAPEAAETFASLRSLSPEGPLAADARMAQARAVDEAGRPDEALELYQTVIAGDPDGPRGGAARLARARLLDRRGRHVEAAEAFADYLARPPAEKTEPVEGILAERGWALLDAERRDEALVVFEEILKDHPDAPRASDARVVLAEAAHAAGDLERAETLLEPLLGSGASVDPALRQSALFRMGLVRFDRQDWSGAMRHFDRLTGDYPESSLAPKARFWSAEAAFQAGDAKAAESIFATILADGAAAEEWRSTARLRHVESLIALGRWVDALTEADALKAAEPAHAASHALDYARGRALQGLGRFEEARTAYQAVIDARRADDFAARAQLMRGETFFHQDRYPEALREFLKVVYNYDAPAHQAAALLEAGKISEKLDRLQDAADFYQKLATEFPDDPNAAVAADHLAAVRTRLGKSAPGR